ncbi:hypothetical protein [Mesorhizobium sp. M1A.F.Ca.IN.020.04.1.1]|uniref:hypothetical protein n=1 Tax=Mesorhizobium sp. M1A.F.Ca.IN.020.04.1.1 TaxID=2496761 RepID=UPI000FCB43ED|nr:hypothetical protein [Mesorhizobium sp. M1A.F.Ca.IN.020.04.1.1]RUW04014.1 hypothetical protein EOA49_00350 [Mesorhizobium sp. M1A.F.Ca.IN.020.04.1.1]RUW04077.1 hypothetical protein EOA49_00685 [Mesorhizobium sp. M1A.F.Ca.IN.020.04.1.1]
MTPEQVSSDPVQPTRDLEAEIKARAAAVLCEAGTLCGWPAPNCNAREGAEALYQAGLLAARSAPGKAVDTPRAIACDEDNMPERIWAGDFDESGFGHCVAGMQGGLYAEYVRADLASVTAPSGAEPTADQELQEVADGAWGDGPMRRRAAFVELERRATVERANAAAPQAVPAEDIAVLIQRLRDRASGYRSSRFLTIPSGLLDEAAAALTLLAACLRRERECYEHSEAEASDLRRKLEEADRRIAKLEADLAFADEQSAKVEALIEPHVKWDEPQTHEAGAIRICAMRDGPCPHGLHCPYVGDSYMGYPCKEGWNGALAASPSAQTDGGGDGR